MLDAIQDFYTNRLDEALDAIIPSRTAHHEARAAYERELAAVETQLAAKEEVIDRAYWVPAGTFFLDHESDYQASPGAKDCRQTLPGSELMR